MHRKYAFPLGVTSFRSRTSFRVCSQARSLSTTQSRIDKHLSNLHTNIQEQTAKLSSSKTPTCLDSTWLHRLDKLTRPEARRLIPELTADNSLGFLPANGQAPTKSSLTYYVMQQKLLHPDKVLLVRVGEFYEAYGVDALMLIEHCGLNPMGTLLNARLLTVCLSVCLS